MPGIRRTDESIIEKANAVISELKWSEKELDTAKALIREAVCCEREHMESLEAIKIIAVALVKIGRDISLKRLEKQGKRRWICGTYTSNVERRLASKLNIGYSAKNLKLLVNYCNNNETWNDVMEALLVCLVKEIRPIIVHSRLDSPFFKD